VTWAAVVLAAGLLDPSTAATATARLDLPQAPMLVPMGSVAAVPLPQVAPPPATHSAPPSPPPWPAWSVCTPCPGSLRSLLLAGVGHE
jgi:hypothetical protein